MIVNALSDWKQRLFTKTCILQLLIQFKKKKKNYYYYR